MTASEMAERFKFEFHAGIATAEMMATPMSEEEQAFNVSTRTTSQNPVILLSAWLAWLPHDKGFLLHMSVLGSRMEGEFHDRIKLKDYGYSPWKLPVT